MLDMDAAVDRHICEGPVSVPRTVDVNCLSCGEEFEATATDDLGTEVLDPEHCPGCNSMSLAVVS